MCGIFGYYNRDRRSLASETLAKMGEAIRHRGPDDQGIFALTGIAIGNQRLSIIDLAGGHQPFISDDGKVAVVQNGEIFNYIELAKDLANTNYACKTQSDTEVLLRLYERDGINFMHKLNGMFAFAIYDGREDALYIVRDRVGVKPLYFHNDGTQITFGSEIKAILNAGIHPAMDEEALHHYLTFNYVPPPYTMYKDIKHLMPGHFMRIDRNGLQIKRWWHLAEVEPIHGRSEEDWIAEFNEILDDSVRLRLRSDVPFGAFLSGGVDSTTIVGLMARHMSEPVKTFCIGFDDPRFDESSFAQEAADRFSTEHFMEKVNPNMLDLWPMATYHCDQPHGDVSFLPTYRVSQIAARHVKVVLTGDGGDELFAGYDKYKNFFENPDSASWTDKEFERKYFDSISLFRHEDKLALFEPQLAKRLADIDSFDVVSPYFAEVKHQDRLNQALYLDMQLLLSGNNLVKPDRMGMAVSLEARTPFLDYRMMEFAFRVPGNLKIKDGVTKYIYKKAVASLIGGNLAYRQKQMFTVPIGEWFVNNKRDYCLTNLKILAGFCQGFKSDSIMAVCNDHISGKKNCTRELRALISLSHWISNGS